MLVVSTYQRRCKALRAVKNFSCSRKILGRSTKEGESPVDETIRAAWIRNLSRTGHEKSCLKQGGPPSKAKYEIATDSGQYREGKVKRTPEGE